MNRPLASAMAAALLAVMVMGTGTAAWAAEDDTFEYSGPTVVTEELTEAEAGVGSDEPPPGMVPTPIEEVQLPTCIACIGGAGTQTQKVSGPIRFNKKFVRYLTGAWVYSTGYTWSSSTTVSSTLTASIGVTAQGASSSIGVSSSKTQTYSISVNIYANKSKLSKLGLYSDFNRYYVRSRSYVGTSYSAWKYAYLYSPLANQYLITTYKS
ncbi:hypothetical protein ARHIZOSPH14_26890 [Agromyces rhizosphaerae]|uniref:Uncharacterized protein n=1 Tax=Agromyces rhizosphaerae TaxID=88374 RepID=A0A9W6D092_9MICO|nr:hypothetical protein [Agromyces rhizosphaerae]GLI28447.1 hypothetical protein ARHIZOSPH14_26890 [Agromyces rhizosphaerae]